MFNYDKYHTAPVSLTVVDNALLRHFVGQEYSIETTNHAIDLRFDEEEERQNYIQRQLKQAGIVFSAISLGLPLYLDICVIILITERVMGSKQRQFMSGIHVVTFWTTTFVYDLWFYVVHIIGLYAIFAAIQLECFTDGFNWMFSFVLFAMFGGASLPVVYIASVFFSGSEIGFAFLLAYSYMTGKHMNGSRW